MVSRSGPKPPEKQLPAQLSHRILAPQKARGRHQCWITEFLKNFSGSSAIFVFVPDSRARRLAWTSRLDSADMRIVVFKGDGRTWLPFAQKLAPNAWDPPLGTRVSSTCAHSLVLEQRRLCAFIGGLEIARHRLASHFEGIGFARPAGGKEPSLRIGIVEFGMVRQQDRRA